VLSGGSDQIHDMKRVLIVLPGAMVVRNWFSTGLLEKLGQQPDIAITVVTPDAGDAAVAERAGVVWRPLLRVAGSPWMTRLRVMASFALHLVIVFRFNTIAGFRGAAQRLQQSRRLRRLALRDGVPAFSFFGWPFPRSRWLLHGLLRLQGVLWRRCAQVEGMLDQLDPALIVIGHVQNSFVWPYAVAAQTRRIPVLGIIGSWDQPTTKGPLVPYVGRILAQSRNVAHHLTCYHGVDQSRIDVVGWIQMDPLVKPKQAASRADLLATLGLSSGHRYVMLGSSPERLGHNEPAIARNLAAALAQHPDCALVIRAHPNDRNWQARFGSLHSPPHVVLLPPEFGEMERMADQIRHASAVLSPAGSILLDAAVLDVPAIALAFENDDEPFADRLARRYEMEHWADLVETGGMSLARNQDELERLVHDVLSDSGFGADGRARLRERHLEPLDGDVGERIVAAIRSAANCGRTS